MENGTTATATAPTTNGVVGPVIVSSNAPQRRHTTRTPSAADMGYEDHQPQQRQQQQQHRRGSMSADEEKQRRASIKAIMADSTISPMAKRRSIQHLMDGRRSSLDHRRNSLTVATVVVSGAANASVTLGAGGANHTNGQGVVTRRTRGGETKDGSGSPTNDVTMGGMGYSPASSSPTSSSSSPSPASPMELSEHALNGQQRSKRRSNVGDGGAAGGIDSNDVSCTFAICNEQTMRAERTRPPCSHYDRNCTLIAPCCGAAFGCRICHDDCPVLPPVINNNQRRRYHRSASLPSSFTSMDGNGAPCAAGSVGGTNVDDGSQPPAEETHHNIDRFAVREVICRKCFTRQSSKSNHCISCGVRFGEYHCGICNLWMSNEESPYHCDKCGFCRVGGAENFLHCDACGMCIDRTLYATHNCKAGKYRSNCPVCQEYLFSSRGASHEMPCGHAIHWDCFRQLAAHDSRCPICKKTAETRERMLPTWHAMAAGVALQPVPPELCRLVNITCNDCETNSENRAWHFLGTQCMHCQSFNTVVDTIVLSGEEAHEFLERQAMAKSAQRASRSRRRVNRRRSAF